MTSILIVGNSGLIGKATENHFLKSGIYKEVFGIDFGDDFDLKNRNSIQAFLRKNRDINYIINASGLNDHVSNSKLRTDQFQTDLANMDEFLALNVKSVCWLIEDARNILSDLRGVVNFASLYGEKAPYHPIYENGKSLSYTVSKHALEGITRYYSTLYGPLQIAINAIRIGGIQTDKQPSKFQEWFVSRTPVGRMAVPEDLFGVMDLLCAEKNSYITGQTITVDGGMTAW